MTSSVTSDRDYLEIFLDDDITISTGGSVDTDAEFPQTGQAGLNYGVRSVTHDLGLVPIVRAFYDPDKNGTWYNTRKLLGTGYQSVDEPWLTTVNTTTTTKLIINSDSVETDIPVYYRIYRFGDESVRTDERIDKIFLHEPAVAYLPAASDSNTPQHTVQSFPHGQSSSVLNTLEFSDDNKTWYGAGAFLNGGFDTASGPPGGPYVRTFYMTAIGYTDANNFYIWYEHNHPVPKVIFARYALDLKT